MAKNHGGMLYETIVPGDFYISNDPGGWTDRATGIHIPGPVVNIPDNGSRMIESVESMPDPVQLPHFKMVINFKDKDRKVQERQEVPFDRPDETSLHDGLNQALSTGIIVRVDDEEMERNYPKAWAARKTHYVYDDVGKVTRPMGDMIAEFHKKRAQEDAAILAAAANKTKTPPPPPNTPAR